MTGPINLGNPTEFTIRELAEQVLAQIGSQAEMIMEPLPADDPRQREPTSARLTATARLGTQVSRSAKAWNRTRIAYFRDELSGAPAACERE